VNMTTGEILAGENGEETVREHMEVVSTKRRHNRDADGVDDVLEGGS
jgi:hypothetical protein